MNTKLMIELFGYLGSALVVISMLMTSVVRLRIINLIGSIIFAIYALIIKSYPTAAMNFFLVGINIYHLLRLRNTEKHYDLVEVDPKDRYISYLLRYYGDDIAKFFPEFPAKKDSCSCAYSVCCDSTVAGITMGRQKENGDLELILDYSTPVYRDCSVGAFLYRELKKKGIRTLSWQGNTPEHVSYLEKMGFAKEGQDTYIRKL